ncbi:MAG TPA: hypothetical protein VGI78_20655 [Acetobacteraceae bacterium]|jgi:hypothetical protein
MDMHTPDHALVAFPAAPGGPPSRLFIRRLLQMLAAATPGANQDDTAAYSENWQATCELFEALGPGDAADAQLAAIAIAAGQSAVDGFVRAARPGMSDETVIRLRGSALAAGRAYAAWIHDLRERQPDATETTPAKPRQSATTGPSVPDEQPVSDPAEVPPGFIALRPGAKPIPAVETFQPRDRFGQPIPDLRTDLMTRAQLHASLAVPRNPALEAEALAEEEAMMAEQAALDACGAAKDTTGGESG